MVRVNPKAFECDLGDSLVIFETDSAEYYRVEGVARDIWCELRKKSNREQIVETLLSSYQVRRSDCEVAVTRFLDSLKAANLIHAEVTE